ncbi:MAG: DUF6328 family protein [Micropruina sp.]|uniref:DUF6328 family protein n=1 Tax=Micropruina sp. TaxID=2737536 RepID=UPI0039E723AD
MDPDRDRVTPAPERNETAAERLDRNWAELLQELRVTETGIQLLTGFLLILPFQSRFADLDPVLVGVFLAAVLLAVLATALVLAPVTAHRLLFRRHDKDLLVDMGSAMAKAGLVCLGLTVGLVATLVVGMVAGRTTGLVVGGVTLLVFLGLWLWLPLTLVRRRGQRPYS